MMASEASKRKDISMLLPATVAVVVITILLLIVGMFAFRFMEIKRMLSPQQVTLPSNLMNQAALDSLIASLQQRLRSDSPDTIVLSEIELNSWLNHQEKVKSMGLRVLVSMYDSIIEMHSSLPVEQLLKQYASLGKYLGLVGYVNGKIIGGLRLDSHQLNLQPHYASINGLEVPIRVVQSRLKFKKVELFPSDSKLHGLVKKLSRAEISDGKLLLSINE